ncbi:MAG: Fe-S cluster domain-containing protein [Candidatus Eisenbacteria bacterium]|uniref:Ion-translocating oxidoreductase complex subunit B n=1 Tax=Eiseniibacteriota bacterium TaxID=2212470 RepID=A0A933SAZ1_UNCEI|nr:Fe-S cluster domain-containing protein [Candidatus Eisenbacteria bacterium]
MTSESLHTALYGLGVFSGLGAVFGIALGAAAERFKVAGNPLVDRVRDRLPSANCGACGFAGCTAYAEAVVERPEVSPSLCIPGRESVARAVAELTGKDAGSVQDRVVVMTCHGTSAYARDEALYAGIPTCSAAALIFGGPRACKNGCLGLADCVRACPFDALFIGSGGIAQVNTEKCTGCAVCVSVCPKDLFRLYPRARRIELSCKAVDKASVVRSTCMVGCTTCRKCVSKCPANAITWDGRTILIDHDVCIAYGPSCGEACTEICPSTILHKVGQSPEPELVEIAEPTGA